MAALALAALMLGACGRDATAPKASLTDTEARDLAGSMASLAGTGVASAPMLRASNDGTYTFETACPAGGTVAANLKVTGSANVATESAVFDVSGTDTSKQCATQLRQGGTITVSGTTSFTAHIEVSAAKPGTMTLAQKGSFDWTRSDGTKGTCTLDLSGSFDPLTQKATVSGTYCGVKL